MRYLAFLRGDDDGHGYGISFPDFPGCVSHGVTPDEAVRRGEVELAVHVEGMEADGLILPTPRTQAQVMADEGLAGWREGARTAWVLLVRDPSPRRPLPERIGNG